MPTAFSQLPHERADASRGLRACPRKSRVPGGLTGTAHLRPGHLARMEDTGTPPRDDALSQWHWAVCSLRKGTRWSSGRTEAEGADTGRCVLTLRSTRSPGQLLARGSTANVIQVGKEQGDDGCFAGQEAGNTPRRTLLRLQRGPARG